MWPYATAGISERWTEGVKANPETILWHLLQRAEVSEGHRHRLIGVPELRPGAVAAVAVIAYVKGDGANASGNVERLLGIHGERGHTVLIVHCLYDLPVADLHIVVRLHLNHCPALVHHGRRRVV